MATNIHGKMHSFSMGFAEQAYDERVYAREVAKICGTKHFEATASPKILDLLPRLVKHYGEPFADSSAIPTWLLSEMTSKHVTVALSGDGGDDLFGGYERYLNPFLYPVGCDTNNHLNTLCRQLKQELPLRQKNNPLCFGTIKYHFHWARFCGTRKIDLCSDSLKSEALKGSTLSLMLDHFQQNRSGMLLDKIQEFELEYYLASTLMTKVDIASMGNSLEVRAPFLDNNVADFALSLPEKMRVCKSSSSSFNNGFETKVLLKKVAEKYLPPNIIYRRKMGFGIPLAEWFREELKDFAYDLFLSKSFQDRNWVSPAMTLKLLDEHTKNEAEHHYGLWTLMMLELWAKEFIDE
jgi:asparagine synthase (glutamine-hydrolysing)